MSYPQLDRHQLQIKPLTGRHNKLAIERDHVGANERPREFSSDTSRTIGECVTRIRAARHAGRPVVLTFGAHTIKNGLAPVLIRLMEEGWVTHLATNGAGIIHDWEFAFQGASSEDVKGNVARGEFGIWQETGFNINLALVVGAYEGLGYGESVGRMIEREGLTIPGVDELMKCVAEVGKQRSREDSAQKPRSTRSAAAKTPQHGLGARNLLQARHLCRACLCGLSDFCSNLCHIPTSIRKGLKGEGDFERVAAAVDLLGVVRQFSLKPGWLAIPHPFKKYSAQAAAFRLKIPFTGHPMIGHDIIYNHPMNHGAALGRTALRDFLVFAQSVSQLQDGVYLSVGSAVMSPMIFEKALSMAQNLEIQAGRKIDRHFIAVVDLAESRWDWQKSGEPPMDNPAYYLRYCKTFSRMGGEMRYICADNRDFLLSLCQGLGARR